MVEANRTEFISVQHQLSQVWQIIVKGERADLIIIQGQHFEINQHR